MALEIDFGKTIIRNVAQKEGYHSCILCRNCKTNFPEGYVCMIHKVNKHFPYDNTKCEDYDDYHYKPKEG